MFDRLILPVFKRPLHYFAEKLVAINISANKITLTGLAVGLVVIPVLWLQWYVAALILILINRILDGLDGEVARLYGADDCGAFIDIVSDFIFYASVVLGFALANPIENSLAAAFLLFSFIGTGTSFLTFGIMAERRKITKTNYPAKGFYYLGGLTEGAETILFFVFCCLMPGYFRWLAVGFGSLCIITTITRVVFSYKTLSK